MSSDDAVTQHTVEKSTECESTDRGLFDFMKKDDHDESKVIATEFDEKVQVSEPEPKFEDCKVVEEEEKVTKPSLLEKLHRSSSSSSSSDEEVEEGGEKKKKKKKEKKGLKEKIEEKIHHKEEDTSVPVEVVTDQPEEKKGFLEKIKEKLPGGGKKVEEETIDCKVSKEETPAPPAPVETPVEGAEPAKKGILEKIKEKIPGYHPKASAEEDKKEKDCA